MTKGYLGRLLIVDDDIDACAFWKATLSEEGYRIDVAHNLASMEEVVERYTVDIVLLDLQLGSENGLD